MTHEISLLKAAVLGIVEGLTEFLPVSSTGHLILTADLMRLDLSNDAVKAFLVVIQGGALLAVMGLYWRNIVLMLRGLIGRSPAGLRLFGLLIVAFIPAAAAALLFEKPIKARLFGPWPVVAALAVGGVVMILMDLRTKRSLLDSISIETGDRYDEKATFANVTYGMALLIGLAQCLALWPGTSRSMVTIVAAILLGLSPKSAAEFSFLLALPTLGAATAHDLLKDGHEMMKSSGPAALAVGFIVSCVVAAFAIRGLVRYLTRHGLGVFGWSRIALAVIVGIVLAS